MSVEQMADSKRHSYLNLSRKNEALAEGDDYKKLGNIFYIFPNILQRKEKKRPAPPPKKNKKKKKN